jgi:hypothetical protein
VDLRILNRVRESIQTRLLSTFEHGNYDMDGLPDAEDRCIERIVEHLVEIGLGEEFND